MRPDLVTGLKGVVGLDPACTHAVVKLVAMVLSTVHLVVVSHLEPVTEIQPELAGPLGVALDSTSVRVMIAETVGCPEAARSCATLPTNLKSDQSTKADHTRTRTPKPRLAIIRFLLRASRESPSNLS